MCLVLLQDRRTGGAQLHTNRMPYRQSVCLRGRFVYVNQHEPRQCKPTADTDSSHVGCDPQSWVTTDVMLGWQDPPPLNFEEWKKEIDPKLVEMFQKAFQGALLALADRAHPA